MKITDMKITIVKYNAGNIQSVLYAMERIGIDAVVTDDHEQIRSAEKVIFPGVGEASTAMHYLKERGLDKVIRELRQPVLGICLGMQLMCRYSEENDTECLGIFDEDVRKFAPPRGGNEGRGGNEPMGADKGLEMRVATAGQGDDRRTVLKVPQIGWNTIYDLKSPLFAGVKENSYCYFVHGYYAALGQHTTATTDYGQAYSSALQKDNFYGVQFHPEKSAEVGEQILTNFCMG
jgi:imidazole glycerol-phosphate synthase subunit HisH